MMPIRKAILLILSKGEKTKEEIMSELKISEFQLRFNLKWLLRMGYVEEVKGKLKITNRGLEYLYQ